MADRADAGRRVRLSSVWREARALVWAQRRPLALGFVLLAVNRAAGLVLPASSKFLIDTVIARRRPDLLLPLALGVAGATAVQAASSFALAQVVSVAGQRAIARLRRELQAHVLRLPIRFYDGTRSGAVVARIMNDPEGIRNLVGTGIVQLAGGLVSAALALGVLFWLNVPLTLGTLALLGTFAAFIAFAFRRLRPIFRERSELTAEVTGRLAETLAGIRVVKAYVAEGREARVFARGVHRLLRNIARTITATSGVMAVATLLVGATGVLILVAGGRAVVAGTMTLGDLVMYVFFVGLMVAPLIQIAGIGTQLSEAFAGLDRIRELRALATEADDDGAREPLGPLAGDVVFENVTYEYRPGVPVLRDISFPAPAGTTTALVGPSGAGKTTVINLVMALDRPRSGRVLVDGHDLARVRLADYRRQLGVVLQDDFLFDGTVRENIAFARPDASEDEVRAAARLAHCDEFVERFEQQYDTVVGERGVKLSGGERQRIAIARAILADPRILILDEATSHLDSESEALIRDGLRALRRGRTTFVIAHRLSTIRRADQILVVEDGQVIEQGAHEELLAAGGRYHELYTRQHGFERNLFLAPGESVEPAEQA